MRAYVATFNLRGTTQEKLVGNLSGGAIAPQLWHCTEGAHAPLPPYSPPLPLRHLPTGERGRVHLAKTLRMGCNLLLLDEPTNDLDVDTLRSLEEAIGSFAGSVIVVRDSHRPLAYARCYLRAIPNRLHCLFRPRPNRIREATCSLLAQVSHDRWFLDRVCDHTLAFHSDGGVEFFEGSVSDFDAWKARRGEMTTIEEIQAAEAAEAELAEAEAEAHEGARSHNDDSAPDADDVDRVSARMS